MSYRINKATVTIHWNQTTVAYDGKPHTPTAVAQGVDGRTLSFTYTVKSAGQNVGSSATEAGVYTVTVTCTNSADQNNYILENDTLTTFVITASSN